MPNMIHLKANGVAEMRSDLGIKGKLFSKYLDELPGERLVMFAILGSLVELGHDAVLGLEGHQAQVGQVGADQLVQLAVPGQEEGGQPDVELVEVAQELVDLIAQPGEDQVLHLGLPTGTTHVGKLPKL